MRGNDSNASRIFRAINGCLLSLLALYLLSYFMIMIRNCPSVDESGVVRYKSATRGSPYETRVDGLTLTVGQETAWNRFFYPMDVIYYQFFHSNIRIGVLINTDLPPIDPRVQSSTNKF